MDTKDKVLKICRAAKEASYTFSVLNTAQKNKILKSIAQGIERQKSAILRANALDLDTAQSGGAPSHMLDRLALNGERPLPRRADLK